MKSRRDVRPQVGVMSRIRTEVARLSWLAGNSKELNIVGTVLGNRGTCLYRTGTFFPCSHCTRVLDAVLRYGKACCGVVEGSGMLLKLFITTYVITLVSTTLMLFPFFSCDLR